MPIVLTCVNGPHAGQKISLGPGEMTFGRDASNTISFNDSAMGKKHARVFFQNGHPMIADLGSTVFINGAKIKGTQPLVPGTFVQMGATQFSVDLVADAPAAPPVAGYAPPAAPAGPLFTAKAPAATLELFNDRIKITRILNQGTKELMLRSISGVQFKPPTIVTFGFIQFTVPGGIESRGRIMDATKDENSVIFNKKEEAQFRQIADLINERISALSQAPAPQVIVTQAPPAPAPSSPTDELMKLAQLLQMGALSQEEFDNQKKRLGF